MENLFLLLSSTDLIDEHANIARFCQGMHNLVNVTEACMFNQVYENLYLNAFQVYIQYYVFLCHLCGHGNMF